MIICPYCNHVFSYTVAINYDGGTTFNEKAGIEGRIHYKILCPNCGKYVEI